MHVDEERVESPEQSGQSELLCSNSSTIGHIQTHRRSNILACKKIQVLVLFINDLWKLNACCCFCLFVVVVLVTIFPRDEDKEDKPSLKYQAAPIKFSF